MKIPKITAYKSELPYDADEFARKTVALCRTYALDNKLLQKFSESVNIDIAPGDIVVLEPKSLGGALRRLPFTPSATRKKETINRLLNEMYTYPRGKAVTFGDVKFLSSAREVLLSNTTEALRQSADVSQEWEQKLLEQDEQWRQTLAGKEETIQLLTEQLERQKEYQAQRESAMEQLRQSTTSEIERWKAATRKEQESVSYLRRKLDQPGEHSEITAWVKIYFDGKLMLHPKAISLLEDKESLIKTGAQRVKVVK